MSRASVLADGWNFLNGRNDFVTHTQQPAQINCFRRLIFRINYFFLPYDGKPAPPLIQAVVIKIVLCGVAGKTGLSELGKCRSLFVVVQTTLSLSSFRKKRFRPDNARVNVVCCSSPSKQGSLCVFVSPQETTRRRTCA